jgi:hypothetical protein
MDGEYGKDELTLARALKIYLLHLGAILALGYVLSWFDGGVVLLVAIPYIAVGVILNRKLLRRLIAFRGVYATIDNQASHKMAALLFWPIAYPVLIMKLGIVRYL